MLADERQSLWSVLSAAAARGTETALPVVGMFALVLSALVAVLTLVMPADAQWSVDGVAAAWGAILIYSVLVLMAMGYALSKHLDGKDASDEQVTERFWWRLSLVLCVLIACWIAYTVFTTH